MLITVVMIQKQHAIVRAFEQVGATTVATACRAEQLGLQPGMAWYRLMGRAVLRCPSEGRYYLDEANWQRLCRRRRVATAAVVAALVVLLVVALAMRLTSGR